MRRILFALVVAAIALPTSSFALITTIDFDSAPAGDYAVYTEGGVDFSASGALIRTQAPVPGGSPGLEGNPFTNGGFRADINAYAKAVCVDIGDYNADADHLYLLAYDVGNNLVGSNYNWIPGSFTGMKTMAVNGTAAIDYVLFGGVGYLQSNNLYVDNFKFSDTAVPEPASLLLIGTGAAVAAVRRRRRKN